MNSTIIEEKSIQEQIKIKEENLQKLEDEDNELISKIYNARKRRNNIDWESTGEFLTNAGLIIYMLATAWYACKNFDGSSGGMISFLYNSIVDIASTGWPFYAVICGPVILVNTSKWIAATLEIATTKIKSKKLKKIISSEKKELHEFISKNKEKIEQHPKENNHEVVQSINSERTINHPVIEPSIPFTSDTQNENTAATNNKHKVLVKRVKYY